ncbi:MAG: hypothetical protein O3A82_17860 [Verrucomicrobia bacterium]|nr:hypothetical protein [Verrucomicrobiota bacterium]
MIRLNNGNPFLSPSLLMFALSFCVLSQAYGREDLRSTAEQKDYINKLKKELLQIKKDLVTLETNNEKPAGTPELSPTIPEVSDKTLSQSPLILKRSTSISATKEDLRRIRKGLLELQGGKTTETAEQEPSLETSLPVRKVVKVRQHNNYFLFVNPGIAFAQDREYSQAVSHHKSFLETRAGLELSIAFGGQIGPWTIGPEIGYRRLGYKSISTPSLPFNTKTETGNSTSYFFALYSGRDIALSHQLNLNLGVSLGVANINETFTFEIPGSFTSHNATEEGSRFQGSIRTAIEYAFSDLCSAHLGYRFSYVNDIGDFGSLLVHQAELGLRLNL